MLPDFKKMYADMAVNLPGTVQCRVCRRVEKVDPAHCLRYGWPKCCGGETMCLGDAPVRRKESPDAAR